MLAIRRTHRTWRMLQRLGTRARLAYRVPFVFLDLMPSHPSDDGGERDQQERNAPWRRLRAALVRSYPLGIRVWLGKDAAGCRCRGWR